MWKISSILLLFMTVGCLGKPNAPLQPIEKELIARLSSYCNCEVEREFFPYRYGHPFTFYYSWIFHIEWNRFQQMTERDLVKMFSDIRQIIHSTTTDLGCIDMPITEFTISLKTRDYINDRYDGASLSFYDIRIACYSPFGKQRIYTEKIFH
jgi:hypothetical protein